MRTHFVITTAILAAIVLTGCQAGEKASQPGLTIAAPNFLNDVLGRAEKQFEEENRIPVEIIYDIPDSVIIRSKYGYRVDLFLAADPKLFRAIEDDTALVRGQYACPFYMSMVLVGRAGGPRADDLNDLRNPEFKRVVIVDPAAGYEGVLAREILKKRRLLDRLETKLIPARSAEQVISYMNTSEADAAIVFEASLHDKPGLTVMKRLDGMLNERLIICGAVTAYSNQPASAQAFLDLLDSRLCPVYDIRGINRTAD